MSLSLMHNQLFATDTRIFIGTGYAQAVMHLGDCRSSARSAAQGCVLLIHRWVVFALWPPCNVVPSATNILWSLISVISTRHISTGCLFPWPPYSMYYFRSRLQITRGVRGRGLVAALNLHITNTFHFYPRVIHQTGLTLSMFSWWE